VSCGAPATTLGIEDATTGLRLCGFWRRVGATFSDNVIMFLPTYIVFAVFGAGLGLFWGFIFGVATQGIYQVRLISGTRGQTVGNRIAQTMVRDQTSGNVPTRNQALKRWGVVAIYTSVPVLIGGNLALFVILGLLCVDNLWSLFDPRNQTLHDRVAETIVVIA
jgi:uncharacterized RDD family membrane protein YckC